MEFAEIFQQFGPVGVMLVGLIYVFVNGSKMQLANANALSDSNKQWASIAGQQQRENEGLSARLNEHSAQSIAQQARIVELSERSAAQAATNEIMERLHEKERATWVEKDEKSDKRIADLERKVDANERTIAELMNEKQAQQTIIDTQEKQISSLESENGRLNKMLDVKSAEVKNRDDVLHATMAELKAANVGLDKCKEQAEEKPDEKPKVQVVPKKSA